MSKNNAIIRKDDLFVIDLMDKGETIEMFGEDYLEEYGVAVPEELIERYKKAKKEIDDVRSELAKFDPNLHR